MYLSRGEYFDMCVCIKKLFVYFWLYYLQDFKDVLILNVCLDPDIRNEYFNKVQILNLF